MTSLLLRGFSASRQRCAIGIQTRCSPVASRVLYGSANGARLERSSHTRSPNEDQWAEWKKLMDAVPKPTDLENYKTGHPVTVHGFLGKRRDKGSLSFCDLKLESRTVQLVFPKKATADNNTFAALKAIPSYSPVTITGWLRQKLDKNRQSSDAPISSLDNAFGDVVSAQTADAAYTEIHVEDIQPLNKFPKDIIVSEDAVWPPRHRHLQLRFDDYLQNRLKVRDHLQSVIRENMRSQNFTEVETPILFKSTPEGAREFLVPTRRKGYAYALPQSPQQYKQILMAGGLRKYFQFAKCFRDEDHRADRQPEFTQMDMEMSFVDGKGVRLVIQEMVHQMWKNFQEEFIPTLYNGVRHPMQRDLSQPRPPEAYMSNIGNNADDYATLSYQEAMENYGTDKPDLRNWSGSVSKIWRVDDILPASFVSMITDIEDPIVEAFKLRLRDTTCEDAGSFIREFMDALPGTTLKLTPGSSPGVLVFDSAKPLQGLSAVSFEAADLIGSRETPDWQPCEDGDIIIIQARKNQSFRGGSTDIGRLRTALLESASSKGLLPKDDNFLFAWIHSFPLFTPDGDDPGQGGSAGFSATHHPFTAPLAVEDLELIRNGKPLEALGDSYDLVLNGVEIGGGSRRIHVAELQEYIMRDVLKMTDAGVGQFSHLLEALRAGCPPHAGFALGFDRLVSVLCDVASVRDVIAFPKNNKGEDRLVGSPNKTTPEQQINYHLFRG